MITKEDVKEEITDFKQFAFKNNMLELSVAMILGGSLNKVVTSISENLFMPILNIILSNTGTSWREIVWKPTYYLTFEIGKLLGSGIDLLLTSFVLYVVYIKLIKQVFERNTQLDEMESKMNFSGFLATIKNEEKKLGIGIWDGFDDTYGVYTYYADYVRAGYQKKPTRILEIGVRLGYSIMALLHGTNLAGVENVEVVGLDTEEYVPNSNALATQLIKNFFPACSVNILKINTVTDELPEEVTAKQFDLIHVDGNHSHVGALIDMQKSWNLLLPGGLMIVDDCTFWDVGLAIKDFELEHKDEISETTTTTNERGQKYYTKKI